MPLIVGVEVIVALDHTQWHAQTRTRWDSSAWAIGPSQRPLPDNTQHSQEINFHDPGGFRTRSSNRWVSTDPRLRPRGHWDRLARILARIFGFRFLSSV